jgi:protein-S-isoprenylcysteine O-methyltransferase Ste14
MQQSRSQTLAKANTINAWLFVAVQAIILGLLVFLDTSFGLDIKRFELIGTVLEWLGGLGILLSAITIRSSLTAVPLPKQNAKLGTTGLYKYVRHPMYTSVLLLSLGIALVSGNDIKYLLVGGLLALFYYKSVYEEKHLRAKFSNYQEYAKTVPRFFPRLK